MNKVFLAIGSNLGEREKTIEFAINKLAENPAIIIKKKSSLLETKPYGNTAQPDFLNGIIEIETSLTPRNLLKYLMQIETLLGRTRKEHWGARTIDLDIIFYSNLVLQENDLTIPHADMQNRSFVLEPLLELAPDFIHPILQKTVIDLYNDLTLEKKVKRSEII